MEWKEGVGKQQTKPLAKIDIFQEDPVVIVLKFFLVMDVCCMEQREIGELEVQFFILDREVDIVVLDSEKLGVEVANP